MPDKSKKQNRRQTPQTQDTKALQLAVGAMNSGQHNPVNFVPLIKFVAPIIARLAARQAVKFAQAKARKRFTGKQSQEIVDATASAIQTAISAIRFTQ